MSSPLYHTDVVADRFAEQEQADESLIAGMWLFLVTEVMFFGGLLAAYVVYRYLYPEAFTHFSKELNLLPGTVNTVVLLTSSFTMAMAVHSAQHDRRKPLILYLALTFLFACAFLGIKAYEWHHEYERGFMVGKFWTYNGPNAEEAELFFRLYFSLTGLHGIHVILGMVALLIFIWLAKRGRFDGGKYVGIENMGLYWHFVDLVWIYLFPLLYLIDRS